MVLVVLLVLALFFLQTLLPTRFREPPAPGEPGVVAEAFGNRDHIRPSTVVGKRAHRALANVQEALPVFLALALTGAWIFFIARVVYVPIYLAGVAFVRTLTWIVSLVGLAMMVVPLLDRI